VNVKRITLTRSSNNDVADVAVRIQQIKISINMHFFAVTVVRAKIGAFGEGITVTTLNVPLISISWNTFCRIMRNM